MIGITIVFLFGIISGIYIHKHGDKVVVVVKDKLNKLFKERK